MKKVKNRCLKTYPWNKLTLNGTALTFRDAVRHRGVFPEIRVQCPHSGDLRSWWLLLPDTDHVPLRIDDFRRVVVDVQDCDLQRHSGGSRRCPLIPRFQNQLVEAFRFTVERLARGDLA